MILDFSIQRKKYDNDFSSFRFLARSFVRTHSQHFLSPLPDHLVTFYVFHSKYPSAVALIRKFSNIYISDFSTDFLFFNSIIVGRNLIIKFRFISVRMRVFFSSYSLVQLLLKKIASARVMLAAAADKAINRLNESFSPRLYSPAKCIAHLSHSVNNFHYKIKMIDLPFNSHQRRKESVMWRCLLVAWTSLLITWQTPLRHRMTEWVLAFYWRLAQSTQTKHSKVIETSENGDDIQKRLHIAEDYPNPRWDQETDILEQNRWDYKVSCKSRTLG